MMGDRNSAVRSDDDDGDDRRKEGLDGTCTFYLHCDYVPVRTIYSILALISAYFVREKRRIECISPSHCSVFLSQRDLYSTNLIFYKLLLFLLLTR